MKMVNYSVADGVATLTMDDGKANAISHALIDELNQALDQAEQGGLVVVLEGREGMFSGGFDLAVMTESLSAAAELVTSGSQLAHRLLDFPTPVVGVSRGHAVAMGAFLLLCCDYRIGMDGAFKYGLNEVAIGMTMHHTGIEIARGRLGRRFFNRAVINAEMFAPDTAVDAGFLDLCVAASQMREAVAERAAAMAALDSVAFRQTKRKAREVLLDTVADAIRRDADELAILIAQGT